MFDISNIELGSLVTVEYEDGQRHQHAVTGIDRVFVMLDNGRKYYINDAIEVRNPFKPARTSKIVAVVPCVPSSEGVESATPEPYE